MKSKPQLIQEIHNHAQAVVKIYRECESDLIDVLIRAEQHRVYQHLEYESLYQYASDGLGLSEEVAYIFINVARKVREVPALGTAMREGKITITKARRISSVLNKNNQAHWLHLAQTSSKRQLEKLVAAENPREAVVEKTKFVSKDRLELQVGVSETLMLKIRRAQDLLSQKKRRPVSLEETLDAAIGMYIDREDPVVVAQRQMIKGRLKEMPNFQTGTATSTAISNSNSESKSVSKPQLCPGTAEGPKTDKPHRNVQSATQPTGSRASRKPLPASVRHRLNMRFQGQCGQIDREGRRCGKRRFLDIHHVRPLSQGGSDEIHNLELLCSGHHRAKHITEKDALRSAQ